MGKVIADRIGVQESVLSKAQQNDPRARLQEEQIRRLMTVCQSEAWLDYWLFSMGYEPSSRRRIQTELEAENDSLKSQIEAMREEKRIALAWLRDAREAA